MSLDYEGFVWLKVWLLTVYVPAPGWPWQGDPGARPGMRSEDRILDVGTVRPVCEKGPKRTPEPKTGRPVCEKGPKRTPEPKTDRPVCKTPPKRTPERSW